MNNILFILIVSIIFKLSYEIDEDNYYKISEEAFTIKQKLTSSQECDISNFAERVVRLLTSEDRESDLIYFANNRFPELQAFHDELFSYFSKVEFSNKDLSDVTPAESSEKLRHFLTALELMMLQMALNSCSRHFHGKQWRKYEHEKNIILLHENVSFSENTYLCKSNQKQSITKTFLPLDKYHYSMKLPKNFNSENEVEMSKHHLIPLTLISQFFQSWLSNQSSSTNSNNCTNEVLSRLTQSMQKLLIVSLKNSKKSTNEDNLNINFAIESIINNNYSTEIFEHTDSFLRGNILVIFKNSDPVPKFDGNEEELLKANEHKVNRIIGPTRSQQLLNLYNNLLEYNRVAFKMTPLKRFIKGFNIFTLMTTTFGGYDIIKFHYNQWEEQKSFENELNKIKNRLNQKESRRSSKIENEIQTKTTLTSLENLKILPIKRLWSEFIIDVMKISIENVNKSELAIWSCDLTRLYRNYLLCKSNKTNGDCSDCVSFDAFLFSKISQSHEWQECNDTFGDVKKSSEWCLAWKRIILNLINNTNLFNYKSLQLYHLDKPKSESYLKDLEIFTSWFSSEMRINSCRNDK